MRYFLLSLASILSVVILSRCSAPTNTSPADADIQPSREMIQQQQEFDQAMIEKQQELQ